MGTLIETDFCKTETNQNCRLLLFIKLSGVFRRKCLLQVLKSLDCYALVFERYEFLKDESHLSTYFQPFSDHLHSCLRQKA